MLGPKRVSRVWGLAAAIGLPERAREGDEVVLRLTTAALALATVIAPAAMAATATATSPALSTTAWWERVTVTLAGDGKTQSCRYEASKAPTGAKQCEVVGSESLTAQNVSATKGETATITFERRFHPGPALPADSNLQTGDTLLGRQVMALAIDPAGKVSGCKVVATSGDVTPEYGCEQASTEKFEVNAAQAQSAALQGFMTVLIYGHSEHVV
jgi:hypothetical protein